MTGEVVQGPGGGPGLHLSVVRDDLGVEDSLLEGLLLEMDGNIGRVARKLKIGSARLRKAVQQSASLSAACEEVFEGAVDEAVGVLFEGLRDENSYQNRFYAAKEFLRTGTARKRGFGHEASGSATLELKDKGGSRTITLRWLEPREELPEEPA